MNPLEIQLMTSIGTILCSGVISALVTHKLSAGRAEKEFRRKKLEELYFAIHNYCIKLFSTNLVWPRVMTGELSYDEANDLIIKNHDKSDKSHDTAQMLINIYFPQLRPHLTAIMERRERINQIHSEFKKSYKRQESCKCYFKPFWDELRGIDSDEKTMTNAIFQISEKYQ